MNTAEYVWSLPQPKLSATLVIPRMNNSGEIVDTNIE